MDVDELRSSSFPAFAREVRPGLVRLARALAGASEGEDVAQEALAVAWQRWDEISRFATPTHWVRRVTANLAITRHRRKELERQRLPLLVGHVEVIEPPSHPDEELWRTVRALPERHRIVVALRIVEGYSYADIAEVVGCSQVNARQLLHRGLTQLRATLVMAEHRG